MTLSSVPTSVSVPIENETNGMLSPMTQLLVPTANETNGIASLMTQSPVPAQRLTAGLRSRSGLGRLRRRSFGPGPDPGPDHPIR